MHAAAASISGPGPRLSERRRHAWSVLSGTDPRVIGIDIHGACAPPTTGKKMRLRRFSGTDPLGLDTHMAKWQCD